MPAEFTPVITLILMSFFLIYFAVLALIVLALIFWIFMIIDVAKRKFKNETDKIAWILIIIFTYVIGAIIYYFIIKRPNKH